MVRCVDRFRQQKRTPIRSQMAVLSAHTFHRLIMEHYEVLTRVGAVDPELILEFRCICRQAAYKNLIVYSVGELSYPIPFGRSSATHQNNLPLHPPIGVIWIECSKSLTWTRIPNARKLRSA